MKNAKHFIIKNKKIIRAYCDQSKAEKAFEKMLKSGKNNDEFYYSDSINGYLKKFMSTQGNIIEISVNY